MKEAYYFSHDANARNDEKILMLRAEHGWEGYGIYWVLIEMMFESTDSLLHHSKIKGISVSYNIDITVLQSVINTCITEELFDSNDEVFWSESLIRRKEKYQDSKNKKSAAGKLGMEKRWGAKQRNNGVITENNKGKEKKVKEIKESKDKEPSVIETYTLNYELIETLNSFIDFRKKIKSPMTDHAIKLFLGKLDKLSNSDSEKIEILNQSIMNGWKGLFPLKKDEPKSNIKPFRQSKNGKTPIPINKPPKEEVTDEEYEEILRLAKEMEG